MSSTAQAQPAPGTVKVTLGTATPGGGFPVYGDAFISAIKAEDAGLAIEPVNTKGSTENVPRLEAGTLDMALVQGEVVHEALEGIDRPKATLSVITAMYPTAGLFVVRADSPYRHIADLKGKKIAWGAAGSGLVILGRYVMDGLGLDAAKDFEPVYLERAGDGPAMVLDGRVAALSARTTNMPGLEYIAARILSAAGGRPIPDNASWATSPWIRPRSSVPASSSGTFSVLPLVLRGSTTSAGSTSWMVATTASP